MAKKFSEITRKAEDLLEQGREAEEAVHEAEAGVVAAQSAVAAAQSQLAAASQTDDEGNPRGDITSASADLRVAEGRLAASERALEAAQRRSERIRQEKDAHVREIDRHNETSRSNLERLRRLESMSFAEDSRELIEGIASRLNEAEDARVALLRSMGIDAAPDYVTVGEAGGSSSGWSSGGLEGVPSSDANKEGLPSGGAPAPPGGGLKGAISTIFGSLFGKKSSKEESYKDKEYSSHEEMDKEVDDLARDYQEHHEKYNGVMRRHESSPDVEKLTKMINAHSFTKDKVLTRRASMKDLGSALAGVALEDLAGRSYQFEGIMSTSANDKLCDRVSSGDVIFKVKIPAGTPGLDLTSVDYYMEAMLDSPYCLIESVEMTGYNTPQITVRIISAGDGINKACDFQSLKQYMSSRYDIDVRDTVESLDFESVKSSMCGVETIIKEFPSLKNSLSMFTTPTTTGVMSCDGRVIFCNPEYYSDSQVLNNTCIAESREGGWIPNSGPMSLGVHEAAHAVEWLLICANPDIAPSDRISAWKNCTIARGIVSKACENIRKTPYGAGKDRMSLVSGISKYAMENSSETMAEAFADVFANGERANPLSIEITRLVHIAMDKYNKQK